MKPRSKRNRKRARSELHDVEDLKYETSVEAIQLDGLQVRTSTGCEWIRTVKPYPYSFSTFAKARWIGRTVLDVYHSEFGSYPKAYYESAIAQGRILVSDNVVDLDYKIKGQDVLTHTVHRHEPAVAVSKDTDPFVDVVKESKDFVVVDKPGTLPVHPCGGYHVQSLMNMLEPKYGKLYTIYRLDRLTSGLVILGKNSAIAQQWGKVIMQRECQKFYLARVAGKFPLNCPVSVPNIGSSSSDGKLPAHGEWQNIESHESTEENLRDCVDIRKRNAHGYWITDTEGKLRTENSFQGVFSTQAAESAWLGEKKEKDTKENSQLFWLHFACPTRVVQPKDGICESGPFDDLDDATYRKTVKPAQSSFGMVRYDPETDSSVVVCKPETGRTHQLRLHLQALGHPIANDPNYYGPDGPDLWYGNPNGRKACQIAHERLDGINLANKVDIESTENGKVDTATAPVPSSHSQVDTNAPKVNISTETADAALDDSNAAGNGDKTVASVVSPATIDVPASEEEIKSGVSDACQQNGESIHEFIERTCVWCARCRKHGADRAMLEFLIRSPGIWLHALQYRFKDTEGKVVCFKTSPPMWSKFS